MMSPWSRPINHADELTLTARMSSYLPAVRPDCTLHLLPPSLPLVFPVSLINSLCIHSLALSGWVKPGVERLLTEQQINVCISAD